MEDKIKQALIDLGWKNPINFQIVHRYDELTIRCNVDGFEEREQNISKRESNCNKPAVSGCDELIEEKIFKLKFPNEEFNIDDYNDWVSENGREAYQLCLKVIKSSHCR